MLSCVFCVFIIHTLIHQQNKKKKKKKRKKENKFGSVLVELKNIGVDLVVWCGPHTMQHGSAFDPCFKS